MSVLAVDPSVLCSPTLEAYVILLEAGCSLGQPNQAALYFLKVPLKMDIKECKLYFFLLLTLNRIGSRFRLILGYGAKVRIE